MGLFGTKAATHTNAPRHWPAVSVKKWDRENMWQNLTQVAETLVNGLRSSPAPVFSLRKHLLFEDGIVEIPMMVEESGQTYAIYAFATVDDESTGLYSACRTLLRQRANIQAVYYASEALRPARPTTCLQALDSPHFKALEEARPDAEYATWWPTAEEPSLADSPALGYLDRWFAATDGYGSFVFTAWAHDLELVAEDAKLVALPAQNTLIDMKGPGDLDMYLLAAQESGMTFAFDIATTPVKDRNILLKLAAEFAEGFREAAVARGIPAVEQETGVALDFWKASRERALSIESAGGALQIGHVLETGPVRTSAIGASDENDRKAVTQHQPSPALAAFAQAEMDEAMKRARALASENGGQGPNLHPFVSMMTEQGTRRVVISMGEEPDVVAATPRLLREHGGRQFVSVAYDGFLTLSGDRAQCVYVLAHEEGREHSFLTAQRYVTRAGKLDAIGNELLVERLNPLFGAAAAGAEVNLTHDQLADQALDQIKRWFAIGPPEQVDPNLELFSTALHHESPQGPKQARYMLMSRLAAEKSATCDLVSGESAGAKWATLTWDEIATLGDKPDRSFRFRVQSRGDMSSTVYAQRYRAARRKPIEYVGGLERVAEAPSLFEAEAE